MVESRMLNIVENILHPLHYLKVKQSCSFSHRLFHLYCFNERYKKAALCTVKQKVQYFFLFVHFFCILCNDICNTRKSL